MNKFEGFNDWIEIFRGGPQRDSLGKIHDGSTLIDTALASFNTSKHEPPVVIGHPETNSPAWAWVESLRGDVQDGVKVLLAKFKQVQPEFEEMVKKGLFKKRSAAFYPDGSLRHVGFLGAMPPAVKGLGDVQFQAGDAIIVEFSTSDEGDNTSNRKGIKMNFKEWKDKIVALFSELPDDGPDMIKKESAGKTFSEADIEEARKTAAEEAAKVERDKVTAEFAEKARVTAQDARKREIGAWCDAMIKDGKLTPAMAKFGIPAMLDAFSEMPGELEFGEGDSKVKATLFDRFKALFETEMPKVITFGEIATSGKSGPLGSTAAEKVDALIKAKMKENKELTYSAAFAEVQAEHRDLVLEYSAEIR